MQSRFKLCCAVLYTLLLHVTGISSLCMLCCPCSLRDHCFCFEVRSYAPCVGQASRVQAVDAAFAPDCTYTIAVGVTRAGKAGGPQAEDTAVARRCNRGRGSRP